MAFEPRKTKRERINSLRSVVVNVPTGSGSHWGILLLSALAVLVTPIIVARISSEATISSTDKDYVNIAVTILNSKESTEENRKWALRILNKLSPVPFSDQSNESLSSGGTLYGGSLYGPDHPFVKKSEENAQPCLQIQASGRKSWNGEQIRIYLNTISRAYSDCSLKQQWALAMIDILQQTNNTPQALSDFKNYKKPIVIKLEK